MDATVPVEKLGQEHETDHANPNLEAEDLGSDANRKLMEEYQLQLEEGSKVNDGLVTGYFD